jgi:Holliday junction resolvase RusA-like endonuclease
MEGRNCNMPRMPRRRTEANDNTKDVKVPSEELNACTGDLRANTGIYRVTIPGRMPSLNEYIEAERRNRYVAAQMKSEKQYFAGLYIRKCLPGVRIDVPVWIHYHWYEPNKRRDKSNACAFGRKVIEDALVQQHVLRDDGWDEIAGFQDHFAVDNDNPRIELEIIPCLDITTSGAVNTTGKAASASTAETTTTGINHSSDAAPGTDATAGTAKRRARTIKKKRKGR